MSLSHWKHQAQKGTDILQNSIQKQKFLPTDKLPLATQKNVSDFPRQSGLLSERELGITDMSATVLVAEMGQGKLSAEEVVVAFLKRAVLGHQLVQVSHVFLGLILTVADSSTLRRSLWLMRPLLELRSWMSIIGERESWSGLW